MTQHLTDVCSTSSCLSDAIHDSQRLHCQWVMYPNWYGAYFVQLHMSIRTLTPMTVVTCIICIHQYVYWYVHIAFPPTVNGVNHSVKRGCLIRSSNLTFLVLLLSEVPPSHLCLHVVVSVLRSAHNLYTGIMHDHFVCTHRHRFCMQIPQWLSVHFASLVEMYCNVGLLPSITHSYGTAWAVQPHSTSQ